MRESFNLQPLEDQDLPSLPSFLTFGCFFLE